MTSIRTFIAVELDASMRDALAGLQERIRRALGPPMRWVKPEGMHLTLKFLGQAPEDLVPSIADALDDGRPTEPPVRHRSRRARAAFPTRAAPASSGPRCAVTSTPWPTCGRTSRRWSPRSAFPPRTVPSARTSRWAGLPLAMSASLARALDCGGAQGRCRREPGGAPRRAHEKRSRPRRRALYPPSHAAALDSSPSPS